MGKAKFTHDKFYFENPLEPVMVHIPETNKATVKINGEIVTGQIELSPEDVVVISYSNNVIKAPTVDYQLTVSPNKGKATLQKKVHPGKAFRFNEITEFQSNIKLELKECDTLPEQTDIEDLYELLKSHHLKGIYKEDDIARIAISEEDLSVDVVVGKAAIPGKPARFELIPGLKDGATVDSQEFFATFVEETPGEAGFDVYGNEYSLDDLFFFPEFGENVLMEDRGLLSLKSGRIVFTPYQIDIIEEQRIQQTINWEDGLVVYEGDVVIDGDIKEGGQIKCTGNLTVNGGVFESYVFSDGHITINGNTDQSVIYSGFSKLAAANIEKFALQYLVIIERVMFESSFTADDGMNYAEKAKSLELAQSEFKAIEQSTAPFISIVQQFGSEETTELFQRFETITENAKTVTLDDQSNSEDMRSVMEEFYAIIEKSKESVKDDLGNLQIESGNSTHLFSYQDINVVGSGTYQSNIEAMKSVYISGKCLATDVKAPESIEINEFNPGNNSDSAIHLSKRNGHIKVDKLSADSIIHFKERRKFIEEDILNAYFDKDNL